MTTATVPADQLYRYLRPSELTFAQDRADLVLSTSGGRTAQGAAAHPVFFDGFLGHPAQAAAALLAVAKVARTRFHFPPGMLARILRAADPVVTSNGDRLRFESFSACCGVYARYDALPGSLDGSVRGTGTTNVDLNPPTRDALARLRAGEPLHLKVGEEVAVRTLDGEVTERRVPLPDRWLKGFAEVQLASARLEPAFTVTASEARRFVRELSGGSTRTPLWVVPSVGRGLRSTTRPTPGGVPLSGAERLKPLEPLLRYARSLRAYAAGPAAGARREGPRGGTSAWELELDDARFLLTLSPDASRGFSGEGAVLRAVVDEQSTEDADLVSALLAFEPRIDLARIASEAGVDEERVARALVRLGAAGRVGYDVTEAGYFHRELPYDADRLATMHPRFRDAASLAEDGAVRLDGAVAHVLSAGTEHVVRGTTDGDRCTCPWFARYRETRGPCKHVLAVMLVREPRPDRLTMMADGLGHLVT